jgi:hypothetical protein
MIVRSQDRLPAEVRDHTNAEIIEASLLDLTKDQMTNAANGCDSVISCLGHNLTFRGLYGQPRRLVRDAVRNLCFGIEAMSNEQKVRFVLMSSSGVRNRDLKEPLSMPHRIVVALLRLLLPPHVDNEQAAEYLRANIGQSHPLIEWVAVRPDGLIDEDEVTAYSDVQSPVRDAIFDAGKVSRINVAHFMATLATEDEEWKRWRGQMPVLYGDEYLK